MKPVYISDEVHKKLRLFASMRDGHMYEFVEEALLRFFSKEWNKKGKRKK